MQTAMLDIELKHQLPASTFCRTTINPDSSIQDSGMLKSKILFSETHESY
jgi:hypothetical protein